MTIPSVYYPRAGVELQATLDGGLISGNPGDQEISVDCIPGSVRIVRNASREPDTFAVELDTRALPFDPYQLRGAGVRIYLYDAKGLRSDNIWKQKQYQRFVGVVDEAGIEIDSSGGVCNLSGVDYTVLFSGQDWDPRNKIRMGRDLRTTVQEILDTVNSTKKGLDVKVRWDAAGQPPKTANGRRARHRKALPIKEGSTVWDVVWLLCDRHDYVVYIDGEECVITDRGVAQDPRNEPNIPMLAYGRNLESINVTRRFTKDVVPQVECSGRLANGDWVTVKYPENPPKAQAISGIGVKKGEVMRRTFKNRSSRDELKRRARALFDKKARGETSYTFTTPHMVGVKGNSLLDLKAESPIQVVWDSFNGESLRQLPVGKRITFLKSVGYSASVANVLANNLEAFTGNRQPYYVNEVELSLSDTSFMLSVKASNYIIEKRENAEGQ